MKNAAITGSTRGIGFAMATEFLRAGCNVTLPGRRETLAEAARTALSPFEGQYNYVPCNVRITRSLQCDFLRRGNYRWKMSLDHKKLSGFRGIYFEFS